MMDSVAGGSQFASNIMRVSLADLKMNIQQMAPHK